MYVYDDRNNKLYESFEEYMAEKHPILHELILGVIGGVMIGALVGIGFICC